MDSEPAEERPVAWDMGCWLWLVVGCWLLLLACRLVTCFGCACFSQRRWFSALVFRAETHLFAQSAGIPEGPGCRLTIT
jgi:hypothetical protein